MPSNPSRPPNAEEVERARKITTAWIAGGPVALFSIGGKWFEALDYAIASALADAKEEGAVQALERFRYHKHKIPHPAMDVGAPYTAIDDSTPEGKAEIRGWDDAMACVERVINGDLHALRPQVGL